MSELPRGDVGDPDSSSSAVQMCATVSVEHRSHPIGIEEEASLDAVPVPAPTAMIPAPLYDKVLFACPPRHPQAVVPPATVALVPMVVPGGGQFAPHYQGMPFFYHPQQGLYQDVMFPPQQQPIFPCPNGMIGAAAVAGDNSVDDKSFYPGDNDNGMEDERQDFVETEEVL